MISIFTAVYPEAKPLIEFYNLKKNFEVLEFQNFRGKNIILSVTGVGGIRVASILSSVLATEPKEEMFCLLIGVCGTKNESIPLGELFLINKAVQFNTKKRFYPDIIFGHNFKENSIESFDKIITDENIKTECELIDMESAYFLEASSIFLPPHKSHVLKIVSDHLDIRHITKEFISSIVEKNIHKIDKFIKNIEKFLSSSKREILSKEEIKVLEKISEKISLTHYMKNELFELYKMAKIKGKIKTEDLFPFLIFYPKTKIVRKNIYAQLKKLF